MSRPAINPDSESVYLSEVLAAAPRLLSTLDREPHSPTYGSFDREHWGWKFRDFPLTMLQIAHYPLSLLWKLPAPENPYAGNVRLLEWILAGVRATLRRQRREGAFDSVAPNARDHGVTLGMVYGLTETANALGAAFPSKLAAQVQEAVRRACNFALRTEEGHAFIANHQALFALAFLNAWELTADAKFRSRAEEIVAGIVSRQSDDGWYQEYGGPDPGYESLAILYLANYYLKTGRQRQLLGSLERSINFFAYCVHNDGSVGGLYGSRHTSLYYPGGFELLRAEIPASDAVARFMRRRLRRRNVLTPPVSDAENLPSLCYGYLHALRAAPRASVMAPCLPCEALDGMRTFAQCGITFYGNSRYYAVVNSGKGGVCRVFNRHSGEVAYEDSGYRICSGAKVYTSQLTGTGRLAEVREPDTVVTEASFAEVPQTVLTPGKFVVLRLLNLTAFHSMRLANWVCRRVVERMITARRPGPFRLNRRIRFLPDQVHISDRLQKSGKCRADEVDLPRAWTAIHMGSAKYFQASELEDTPVEGLQQARAALESAGQAEIHQVIVLHTCAASCEIPAER